MQQQTSYTRRMGGRRCSVVRVSGSGERVERRKGVSQICTAGGLGRWVLVTSLLLECVLVVK